MSASAQPDWSAGRYETTAAELEPALADLLPDAAVLAQLAAHRTPSDAPLAPLYLRAPDAQPERWLTLIDDLKR